MRFFFHWFVVAVAIGITASIIPSVSITLSGALIAAVVLGALNLFIRPIIFLLTLPLTILTLGIFSIVINSLLVWLTAVLVPGFSIAGFWDAFLFAIVLSIINWLFTLWKHD